MRNTLISNLFWLFLELERSCIIFEFITKQKRLPIFFSRADNEDNEFFVPFMRIKNRSKPSLVPCGLPPGSDILVEQPPLYYLSISSLSSKNPMTILSDLYTKKIPSGAKFYLFHLFIFCKKNFFKNHKNMMLKFCDTF